MNTRTTTIFVLAGIALLFGLSLYAQEDQAQKSQAWEHLAFEVGHETSLKDPKLTDKIVQLGDEGWELVNVVSRTKMGNTTRMVYYFKRPK